MALSKVTYTDLVTVIGAQNLNDIQDAIIALEEWQSEAGADIPQILADIAPSFSNSTNYSAGDCVIVLNKLYQFTADHPAGNWTGADATEVNVTSLLKEAVASLSGEVDDLKSAVNDLFINIPFELDGYIQPDGTFRTAGAFVKTTQFFDLKGIKTIAYQVGTAADTVFAAFYDETNTFLSSLSGTAKELKTGRLELPENAAFVRFTSWFTTADFPEFYAEAVKGINDVIAASVAGAQQLTITPDFSITGFLQTNGLVYDSAWARVTDFLVTDGVGSVDVVLPKADGTLLIAFYDELKKFISGEDGGTATNLQKVKATYTIPAGAKYFRLSKWEKDISYDTFATINIAASAIQNSLASKLDDEQATLKYGDSILKPFDFAGKSIASFGDSITGGTTSPNLGNAGNQSYIHLFASHAGATLNNLAVGGSCITDADGVDNSICDRILAYTGNDQFIIIAGGVNDYVTGKPVGEFGDTSPLTFYGALHTICEYLTANHADKTVIFITPINITKDFPNAIARLNVYRNAIFEMASEYKFSVVNGADLGLPSTPGGWGNTMIEDSDGCHPTLLGHYQYFKSLCGKLL